MRRVSSWVDARAVPLVVTGLLAVAGAAYWFYWLVAARHGWQSYSDLWNSAGLALDIGHGHFASVYTPSSYLDSPPGLEFLLAPVMLALHGAGLGTTAAESSTKVSGLLLAAVATALACTVLFALDAVARQWEYSDGRRLALAVVAGLGVVSAAVFWGHPEDCIALAFVLWAALAVERRGAAGLRHAGWLLGVAVAFQPLALLAVAPIVARARWRDVLSVAWRLVVPSVLVLLPELLATPARALHAVVDQPFFPPKESATPFSHLARSLGHGMYSGGTLRLVATLVAVVVGWVVCRRRHDLPFVLFVMAIAFTLRVVFESELLGFYFFPVIAVCLLLSLRSGWARFNVGAAVSLLNLALGNRREHTIALWWPAMMATVLVLLVLAYASLPAGNAGGADVRRLARRQRESWVTISHVRLLDAQLPQRVAP
jgi:hypothetical protein